MSRKTIGAALAVAALALAGTASADTTDKSHGSHDRTIRLVEANTDLQPTFVDTGKPGPSVGDIVVARDAVLRENGSPAGTFRQICTLVDLVGDPFTSTYECTGSLTLKDGTITMEGPFTPSQPESVAAITGGTGALPHRAGRDRRPRRGRPDRREARPLASGVPISGPPDADRPSRTTHQARNGALLFGAASLVTLLGLLLPHEAEVDTLGLTVVAAGSAALAVVLVVAGEPAQRARLLGGDRPRLGADLPRGALQRRAQRRAGRLRRALLPVGRLLRRLLPAPPQPGAAGPADRRRLRRHAGPRRPGADRDEPLAHGHRPRHRRRGRGPPAHRARRAADGRARQRRQHRPPDGARQPARARGGLPPRGGAGGPHGRVDRDRADRPQSLQGHQRRLRARGRRHRARRDRRAHAPRPAGDGRRRPHRRRRVPPAAPQRRRRRCDRRRAAADGVRRRHATTAACRSG